MGVCIDKVLGRPLLLLSAEPNASGRVWPSVFMPLTWPSGLACWPSALSLVVAVAAEAFALSAFALGFLSAALLRRDDLLSLEGLSPDFLLRELEPVELCLRQDACGIRVESCTSDCIHVRLVLASDNQYDSRRRNNINNNNKISCQHAVV